MSVTRPPSSRRDRWNKKHADSNVVAPAELLVSSIRTLPRGRCLDIACGLGRHVEFMAEQGYQVDGIDWSLVALKRLKDRLHEKGLHARLVAANLLQFPLKPTCYDVILCFRYLERGLWRSMSHALRPGGVVVFETRTTAFLHANPDYPKEYCLMPGELLRGFSDLSITHYHESTQMGVASLIAHRPVA